MDANLKKSSCHCNKLKLNFQQLVNFYSVLKIFKELSYYAQILIKLIVVSAFCFPSFGAGSMAHCDISWYAAEEFLNKNNKEIKNYLILFSNFVLVEQDLDEITWKSFFNLDPLRLKNCKCVCSEWFESNQKRLCNIKSAKQLLQKKLINQCKLASLLWQNIMRECME